MRPMVFCAAILGCMVFAQSSSAEVTLPSVFADNMVLQRGMELPVWGKAAPGEAVTVEIAGRKKSAVAGADGRWAVRIDAMDAGGPVEMTVAGANVLRFTNVLIGDVWLASGQSNMAMSVSRAKDAEAETAAANFPRIRLCTVPEATAEEPQFDCRCRWVECSPETVPNFSAAAYFFARDIHGAVGVPVGIIDDSWSGSVAEAWTSAPALERHRERLAPLLNRWREKIAAEDAKYDEQLAQWEKLAAAARAAGDPQTPKPERPKGLRHNMHHPSNLYNAMIAPLVPFAIRGVVWYQGEGNSGRADQYSVLFPTLIKDWRANWGQGDIPFLFVQLANYRAARPEPVESNWAELREVQMQTLSLPNTGMAVAIDVGEATDLHPKDKQSVGKRLALAARALVYGENIVYSGPIYDSMTIEGAAVRLSFTHVGSGLVAAGGGRLKNFAVAGQDRKFIWADAAIDGESVVVSSEKVPQPVAVRYAWQDNPGEVNFYNAEGLPASPFRTDDWPRVTTVEQWPGNLD